MCVRTYAMGRALIPSLWQREAEGKALSSVSLSDAGKRARPLLTYVRMYVKDRGFPMSLWQREAKGKSLPSLSMFLI